jgi:hypothetical protein
MSQHTLAKIGFFHFGEESQSNPVGSLRDSLEKSPHSERLDDCLLVLPEAFNIRNGYEMPGKRIDVGIAQSLKELSASFKVGFVAGLIEESDGEGPHSSAYLIDGDVCERLSRKMQDDQSGNYKISGNCDSPCLHRGVYVAALICVDAAAFNVNCQSERHKALLERLDTCGTVPKLICVPAHFKEWDTRGVALAWPSRVSVVIANSWPHQASVIRRMDTEPICVTGWHNAIRVAAFAS